MKESAGGGCTNRRGEAGSWCCYVRMPVSFRLISLWLRCRYEAEAVTIVQPVWFFDLKAVFKDTPQIMKRSFRVNRAIRCRTTGGVHCSGVG